MKGIDASLGFYANALKLRAKRSELLANNLSNAETPGFKGKDFDVTAALRQTKLTNNLGLTATSKGHLSTSPNANMDFDMILEKSLQGAADKNTVDSEIEKVRYAENALRYQTTLKFLNGTVKGLLSAIKGE